ncbi:50S ribosomal protein L35 [Candidatus Falkowbacteria bacterium]|nr:50S ribosomal protein L35 [Candidatus Falkowbacteria bacterium]
MPKLKSHKSIVKRIKMTKTGKLLKRKGGQDHFNAHESGKKMRRKRRDIQSSKTEESTIRRALLK